MIIAGKPCSYRYDTAPVGARLGRDEGIKITALISIVIGIYPKYFRITKYLTLLKPIFIGYKVATASAWSTSPGLFPFCPRR
jgi:hypothetical protein